MQSQSGTGKTCVFSLGALSAVSVRDRDPQAPSFAQCSSRNCGCEPRHESTDFHGLYPGQNCRTSCHEAEVLILSPTRELAEQSQKVRILRSEPPSVVGFVALAFFTSDLLFSHSYSGHCRSKIHTSTFHNRLLTKSRQNASVKIVGLYEIGYPKQKLRPWFQSFFCAEHMRRERSGALQEVFDPGERKNT